MAEPLLLLLRVVCRLWDAPSVAIVVWTLVAVSSFAVLIQHQRLVEASHEDWAHPSLAGRAMLRVSSTSSPKPNFTEAELKAARFALVAQIKIVDNILKHPKEEMYHQIWRENPVFQKAMVESGHEQDMRGLHFELLLNGQVWAYDDTATNLRSLKGQLNELQRRLKKLRENGAQKPRCLRQSETVSQRLGLNNEVPSIFRASSARARSRVAHPQGLEQRGFQVTRLNTYTTQPLLRPTPEALALMEETSIATFGSPSAVRAWSKVTPHRPLCACIGGTSQAAAEAEGFTHIFAPERPGISGWAEVTVTAVKSLGGERFPARVLPCAFWTSRGAVPGFVSPAGRRLLAPQAQSFRIPRWKLVICGDAGRTLDQVSRMAPRSAKGCAHGSVAPGSDPPLPLRGVQCDLLAPGDEESLRRRAEAKSSEARRSTQPTFAEGARGRGARGEATWAKLGSSASRLAMPIAGRENRLSTSGSLETTQVWQKAVGYDPYAGEGEAQAEGLGPGEINSSAKGLFRLAQLTGEPEPSDELRGSTGSVLARRATGSGHSSTIAPGACKRCGSVGHLYFQCRNMFTLRKEEKKLDQFVEDDDDEDEATPQTKLKKELQLSGDLMQFAVENKQTPQETSDASCSKNGTCQPENAEEVKEKQKLLSLFLEIARNSTRTLKALQNRTASISMLPFGSCVTGCGARGADVDACVFFEDAAPPDRNVLRRPRKWVSKGRYAKSYVEIMPELAVLAMAVKCWAKRQEVGSVLDGGLSSYAWTLLIVYYLQVCHGLPSLHKGSTIPTEKCWVYWERRVNKKGKERKPRHLADPDSEHTVKPRGLVKKRSNHSESLGAWFQGFFDFYANDFDWKEERPEVVSVRCGRRLQVEDPSFAALKVDRAKDLQIEERLTLSRDRDGDVVAGVAGDPPEESAKLAVAQDDSPADGPAAVWETKRAQRRSRADSSQEGPPEEAAVSMRRTELRNKQAKLQAQKATLEEEVRKLELQLQELPNWPVDGQTPCLWLRGLSWFLEVEGEERIERSEAKASAPTPILTFDGLDFDGDRIVNLRARDMFGFTALGGRSKAISISFIARWDAFALRSRIVDFGDGPSRSLFVEVFRGPAKKRLTMPGCLALGETHRYLLSISETGLMRRCLQPPSCRCKRLQENPTLRQCFQFIHACVLFGCRC
eukprot:g19090.t1